MNYIAIKIDSILIVCLFILKDTFDFKIKSLGTYTTCQCIHRHDDKMSSNIYIFDRITLHNLKVRIYSNSLLQWFLQDTLQKLDYQQFSLLHYLYCIGSKLIIIILWLTFIMAILLSIFFYQILQIFLERQSELSRCQQRDFMFRNVLNKFQTGMVFSVHTLLYNVVTNQKWFLQNHSKILGIN